MAAPTLRLSAPPAGGTPSAGRRGGRSPDPAGCRRRPRRRRGRSCAPAPRERPSGAGGAGVVEGVEAALAADVGGGDPPADVAPRHLPPPRAAGRGPAAGLARAQLRRPLGSPGGHPPPAGDERGPLGLGLALSRLVAGRAAGGWLVPHPRRAGGADGPLERGQSGIRRRSRQGTGPTTVARPPTRPAPPARGTGRSARRPRPSAPPPAAGAHAACTLLPVWPRRRRRGLRLCHPALLASGALRLPPV